MKTIILGSVQYFSSLIRLAQENKKLGILGAGGIQLKCFQGVF